jgi:hypothetical protein
MRCAMLAGILLLGTSCGKQEKGVEKATPAKTPPEAVDLTKPIRSAVADAQQTVQTKVEKTVQAFTVSREEVLGELTRPLADIQAKAAAFTQPEVLAYANAYKETLLSTKEQLAGVAGQLKQLPVTELLGEKGKALKEEVARYTSQFNALKERYTVYLDLLKKFGVDLSSFGL